VGRQAEHEGRVDEGGGVRAEQARGVSRQAEQVSTRAVWAGRQNVRAERAKGEV
jgi:hypothetical protein